VREVKTRIPKRVLARQRLPKFGEATGNDVNVTLISPDLVAIEHPDDQLTEDADDPAMGNSLTNFILKQQERAFERENDMAALLATDESQDAGGDQDAKDDSATPAGGSGKYVPPSARGGGARTSIFDAAAGGKSDRDHENTLRVSNLTKRVTEEDLRELFERFGNIFRVSLPRVEKKDEHGNIFKEPRGFAYVAFSRREDAATAMERLQGYGYDHLILKLEWAKPPSADGPSGGGGLSGNGFVSGYGQKLAQETKEQVSYASNLTGNTR
jgi:translation initiation factor 3 subunit G